VLIMSTMRPGLARGFNIIELMVVVSLIALLLMVGMPSFQLYSQNAQTRAGAEALLAGLQVAKSEAIRRNVSVQMKLTDPTQSGWKVNLGSDPDGTPLMARVHEEGSGNAIVVVTPSDADTVTFSGLGRVTPNADATPPLTAMLVDNPMIVNVTDRRPLRIVIPVGGAIKLCDPNVALTDPRAC
jgi:type IV fimbrial biogenesis protein FimT